MKSRAYQMPAVRRAGERGGPRYVFAGPEVRRLTAEQFADAIGAMTGEWNIYPGALAGSGQGPARRVACTRANGGRRRAR